MYLRTIIKLLNATKWIILLNILWFIHAFDIKGQACCSGGVPISNQIGIRPTDKHQLSIRGTFDGNFLNSFYNGTNKLDDTNVKRFSQTIFLQGIYGISDRVSINAMMAYVHHKRTVKSAFTEAPPTKVSGIGDAILLAQYKLFRFKESSIYITGGLKIPTGNSEMKNENGILLPSDLQPGTGSWDLIFSSGYVKNHFIRPGMSFTSTVVAKMNSYSDRYMGQQQYKYGNDFQFLLGITDSFILRNTILNPGLLFRLWHTSPDKIDDNLFPNTGGSWIYIAPSLNIQFTNNISGFASAEIPVYQFLEGTQLSTTIRFAVGFQLNISTSKNKLFIPEFKDL